VSGSVTSRPRGWHHGNYGRTLAVRGSTAFVLHQLGREVGFRVAKVLIVDSKLKVITVSSSGRVLQAGCPLGASVALRKPIDVTELVAAVRRTVQEQASA
jgi:DNA-binding response OmpR family regulator